MTMRTRSRLHTVLGLLTYLSVVMGLSTLVLTAINLDRQLTFYGVTNRVDPAFLVAGVLGLFFFLASLISGLRATGGFKPSLNLAGAAILAAFYFACAVSYSVLSYSAPRYCSEFPIIERLLSGCRGMIQALIAFAWVDFGLAFLYIIVLFMLVSKHSKLPWEYVEVESKRQANIA